MNTGGEYGGLGEYRGGEGAADGCSPGSMCKKTDGQQAGGTYPTGMHSC